MESTPKTTIGEEAFGVLRQKDPEEYVPTLELLEAPLTGEDSFIRSFCRSCDDHFELTKEGAEDVARNEEFELPEDPSRSILVFASCSSCKTPVDEPVSIKTF